MVDLTDEANTGSYAKEQKGSAALFPGNAIFLFQDHIETQNLGKDEWQEGKNGFYEVAELVPVVCHN
jgi:hypothetical protein